MFESSSASIIRSSWWPRGGMVDTMDLKSMPFWECRFKSGRGYQMQRTQRTKVFLRLQMQRTRFFLRLFFWYCRNQVAMCRIGATNKKIFVGNGGFIINE